MESKRLSQYVMPFAKSGGLVGQRVAVFWHLPSETRNVKTVGRTERV